MLERNTILTINVVEPSLVRAVKLHSQAMGRELKGLVLVHTGYADYPGRLKDDTGLFDEIVCNCDDPDEIQTVLKPYTNRLLAVTYRYENAIESLRKVIPFLPYIYTPSESALLWCTDKFLMRNRLGNYDRNLTPKYRYVEEHELPIVKELIRDFEFPLIVKPSGLVDSLLVEKCETEQMLEERLKHTFRIIREVYDREFRLNEPGVLIEEMMQGEMYSTDAYVTHDGEIFCLPLVKVITSDAMGLPGFYTYRTIVPTSLPENEVQAAFAAARASIKALNLSSSSAHIELYRTQHGWKIIELGARIGGHREALYREVYGIEHFYNDIAVRMGMKPTMPQGEILRHAAGMTIYANEEGYIESLEGMDELHKLPGVVFFQARSRPGDLALFASNGGRPIFDVIMSDKDPERLEKNVARARQILKVNIKSVLAS